jgi:hypothetical protein
MQDLQTIEFECGAAINPYRLVKIGASNGLVIEAVDAAAAIIGVSRNRVVTVTGDRIPIQINGIAKVRIDGTPARGTVITATTAGKGAAIGAGTANQYVAGTILQTAADEDLCDVLLNPGGSVNLGIT